MNIHEQLQHDLKTAMRAGERQRVEVIRMTLAALKNAQMAQVKAAFDAAGGEDGGAAAQEAAEGARTLSEAAMQDVVVRETKRRREAAEAYHKAGREDLAASEEAESAILQAYLPRQLSADELRPLVAAAIAELGGAGPGELGKVMPALMQRFKSQADGRVINQIVREVLGLNR
jgi:uncharacterized protein YqeY